MERSQTPVSLSKALWRGLRMRCPACGEGKIFARFLKVADHCPSCREEMFHHQADDYPAYLVIFIVGKLVFASVLAVELAYAPPLWVHFTLWLPLVLIGALALLPPVKGGVVALQWHLGLHGFEPALARRQQRSLS